MRCRYRSLSAWAVVVALMALAAPALAEEEDLFIIGSSEEVELDRKRNAPPVLVVSPKAIEFRTARGKPGTKRLVVRNGGGRTLEWAVSTSPAGVKADPGSGRLGYGEEREVLVEIDASGLPTGTTRGYVLVDAAGADGSPVRVAVTIVVPEPAVPGPDAGPDAGVDAGKPAPDVATPSPAGGRKASFGVRAGLLMSGKGETVGYDPAALVGVVYSPGRKEDSRLSYELGADFSRAQAAGSEAVSDIGIARADVLFGRRGKPYLLSGLKGYLVRMGGETAVAGGVNLGGGFPFAGGKLDLRLTHSLLVGSSNVGGLTLVTLGASF